MFLATSPLSWLRKGCCGVALWINVFGEVLHSFQRLLGSSGGVDHCSFSAWCFQFQPSGTELLYLQHFLKSFLNRFTLLRSALLVTCTSTGIINTSKLFFFFPYLFLVTPEPISTTVTVHTTVQTSTAALPDSEGESLFDK